MAPLTPKDVADLARTVAYLADAVAQYLDGSMDKAEAAGHLHQLNGEAQRVYGRLSA